MSNLLSQENINRLRENKHTLDLPNSRFMSLNKCNLILETVSQEFELTEFDSMTLLAIFAQIGGTTASCDGNRAHSYLGKNFKLSQIRKIFAKCGAKNQFRKFARTNGALIQAICSQLEIEGNMYQKIINLNLSNNPEKYKYWLSDFQAYTQEAPEEATRLIISAFPKRRKNKHRAQINLIIFVFILSIIGSLITYYFMIGNKF